MSLNGIAYSLGVSLGLASVQASFHQERSWPYMEQALQDTYRFATTLRQNGLLLDPTKPQNIHRPWSNDPALALTPYQQIVQLLSEYEGVIKSSSALLGKVYDLGVNIALAEGQTAGGNEASRKYALASLLNAQSFAITLAGDEMQLELGKLQNIIVSLNAGVPLNTLYSQIAAMRGEYQGILNAT